MARAWIGYTPELGNRICERLATGERLDLICRDDGFPSARQVFRWLKTHEVFCERYRIAREEYAIHTFTQEMADLICERLAEGESLNTICKDDDFPSMRAVSAWVATNDAFREQYRAAREAQAELLADELVDIADDRVNDYVERTLDSGRVVKEVDHEHINRARLKVDTRKWVLSKLKPGTYGDKVQHANAAGDGNQEVTHKIYSWADEPDIK